jgi:hypothetical protein
MPQDEISYTELTYRVVRESLEPLPFNEIVQRVHALRRITTKNPKTTIRNAIGQGCLILATGDGRYGWKPRLITGSVLRVTLSESDLAGPAVEFDEDVRDALWPSFFEIQKRCDLSPVKVQLPDGTVTQTPLDFLGKARWGTTGSPEFWVWFKALKAKPGDHLIFRVLDGVTRLYNVKFEPRSRRDEAAVAERSTSTLSLLIPFRKSGHSHGGSQRRRSGTSKA